MRSKLFIIISLLAVVSVVLSACAAAPGGSQEPTRSLNITGVGQVFLKPDIAYINIGVHTEDPSATAAVTRNNAQTQKVADALTRFGVAVDDIRTTNFNIWANTQYDRDGQPTGTSYVVDNTVYVTVRDLTKMGEMLDAVVKAGANTINSIQFDVADKTEAMTKARDAAIENAKKQAAEIATAVGVELGAVQSINFYDAVPSPVFDGKGGGGAELAAAVPIQPGQLSLSVTVNLVYEIK